MAGPNLLAYVLVSKFDDHVPLYRQNEIFARMGADISDTTLVDWCGGAMKALAPLIEKIEAISTQLRHEVFAGIDEDDLRRCQQVHARVLGNLMK